MHQKICGRFQIAGVVALLSNAPLFGASALQDFYDGKMADSACEDISKMDRQEIEVFISFLATNDNKDGAAAEANCNVAREVFIIKFARGRAIDRMTVVLRAIDLVIGSTGHTAKPGSKEMKDLIRMLDRRRELLDQLRFSTTLRFQSLAKVL